MSNVFVARRLYGWDGEGKAGVVKDTIFVRCFWPRLDEPAMIFAAGSSGLKVLGPPTPRNVVFPEGTQFLMGCSTAKARAEAAVRELGHKGPIINLPPKLAEAYWAEYEKCLKAKPGTIPTRHDCFFLRHNVSRKEKYISELTEREAKDLCEKRKTRAQLEAGREFHDIEDSPIKSKRRFQLTAKRQMQGV